MKRSDFVVVLGTAHGSNIQGKQSPDGRIREYWYSREICSRVEKRLQECGCNVCVDVRQPIEPSLNYRVGIVNDICRLHGAKNVCYVSIHLNAAGMGDKWMSAKYWSVWTSRGQTRGDRLASCLWDEARKLMPQSMPVKADWRDGDADYESNFYVLKHTSCAAALTENLFQDNRECVDWLLTEEGKQTITDIHVNGILKYIDSL